MSKLKVAIIKRVLMLDTEQELKKIECNVLDAISRECDLEEKKEQEFKKWKENQING